MIEVSDSICLVAYKVIEAIRRVCIDETVTNPFTCSYRLLNVSNHFKCRFDAILVSQASIQPFQVSFAAESKDVRCVGACKSDELARLRPVDLDQSEIF